MTPTNTDRIALLVTTAKHVNDCSIPASLPAKLRLNLLLRLSEELNLWEKDRLCSSVLGRAERIQDRLMIRR